MNRGANWLNGAPGALWRAAYGTKTVPQIDQALGISAAESKSAGAMRGLGERRKAGLEVLSDMTDQFQVKGPDGELVPYRPHDPGTTFAMDADALAQGKKAIWEGLEKANAKSGGVKVDLSGLSSKLRADAARPTLGADARARALQLADQIDGIAAGGLDTPSGIQEFLTDLNAGLRGVLSGGAASRTARVDADAASAIADALDSAVINAGGAGKAVPLLRDKYAALKAVESALLRQARAMANKGAGLEDYINPFNLVDALAVAVDPTGWVAAAKAAGRAGLMKLTTGAKDKNAILREIFRNLARARGIPIEAALSPLQSAASAGIGGASAAPVSGLVERTLGIER